MRFGKWIIPLVFMIHALIAAPAGANLILNWDFENNSATETFFNLTNSDFNALVPDVTAFGSAEEIDLVTGTGFGIAPQSGAWKLGLHSQAIGDNGPDAFSMALSSPILIGTSYDLSFFAARYQGVLGDLPSSFEIGLSSISTAFGTTIYAAGATSPSVWDSFSLQFLAPANASYLTMRVTGDDTYTFVDNFSLDATTTTPIPEPSTVLLVGIGIAGMIGRAWRRRRS